MRDHTSKLRRPFIRFFACASRIYRTWRLTSRYRSRSRGGSEALLVVGAVAGGVGAPGARGLWVEACLR